MLKSPGSIAFELGPIVIHWYGIIIAIAFLIGLLVTTNIAKKQNENPDHILNLSTYLLLGAVFGARLYFVLFNGSYYLRHPQEILMLWQGGLSIHGALLGGIITIIAYTKFYKLSLLKYLDILAYGTVLGQAIGRWGNFFNSEAFGLPTNLPLIKLYIPAELRPLQYKQFQFFHPTFLYESLWDLTIFILLFFVFRKKLKSYNGAVFFLYLTLYSTGRFFIEALRIDSIYFLLGMPLAQIISIILIIIGIAGLYIVLNRKQDCVSSCDV